MIKLNNRNLTLLPKEVDIPTYDRSQVKTGIVHVGIGGFHRAHQAFYTDALLQHHGASGWGICGVALLEGDKKIYDALVQQDGLYTVVVTKANGLQTAKVIGSIVECLWAPQDAEAVIQKMADPVTRVITLTITEGGYNFDAATGAFLWETPAIKWDLSYPHAPKTIFGYLAAALKRRQSGGTDGLTIQSCDNLQHNGTVTRRMLLAYLSVAEPSLVEWVERHVAFPNSMVDRITPVTTAADIQQLQETFNIDDTCPVVCEPFYQWIIEDNFYAGRPDWDKVGAQLVPDVGPYENMKIRILNGGHSLTGFLGILNGYSYVSEAIHDPHIQRLVTRFHIQEVFPILDPVHGVDIKQYQQTIIERFANPFIKDQLTRIISGSSAKIPKFIVPTIREQLHRNGPIELGALLIALWCHYLQKPEALTEMQDNLLEVLRQKARESAVGHPLAFLQQESVFGDLSQSPRFVDTYIHLLEALRFEGVREVLHRIESQLTTKTEI